AQGHLQASGAIANGDVVRIGGVYYQWTNASVDTGAPAGTSGDPWLVNLGASNTEAMDKLFAAVGATGIAGADYSTVLIAHTEVKPSAVSATDLYVLGIAAGAGGNAIVTTETGANIEWGAGTLGGGGSPQLRQVQVPGDIGAISVASLNRYVIVVP